jgi:hypothetical protein
MSNEIELQMQDIEVYLTITEDIDKPTPREKAMIKAMHYGDLQYLKELLHA